MGKLVVEGGGEKKILLQQQHHHHHHQIHGLGLVTRSSLELLLKL
jgi:hypothetical protein